LQKNSKNIVKDEFGYKIFQKICKLYPEVSNHHSEDKMINGKGFVRNANKKSSMFENSQIYNNFANPPFFPIQNFPKYLGNEKNNFT